MELVLLLISGVVAVAFGITQKNPMFTVFGWVVIFLSGLLISNFGFPQVEYTYLNASNYTITAYVDKYPTYSNPLGYVISLLSGFGLVASALDYVIWEKVSSSQDA